MTEEFGSLMTNTEPLQTCDVSRSSRREKFIAADGNVGPCHILEPSVGSYANGMTYAGAEHGDSANEGEIWQADIQQVHPSSTTPYDKTTAWGSGKGFTGIKHKVGQRYWLKGSNLSLSKGQRLKTAAAGLVQALAVSGADIKICHTWEVVAAVSSATYVLAEYKGYIVNRYTA